MKGEKKYFFYFLILDQLYKDLHIMKHPIQILLFFHLIQKKKIIQEEMQYFAQVR